MSMRALTVVPGCAGSAHLEEVDEPPPEDGEVLVKGLAVGICGTDAEIVPGDYGEPLPGDDRLVVGHESLGRVLEAPVGSGLEPGDLVAGIVRRPDPVPFAACAGPVGLMAAALGRQRGMEVRVLDRHIDGPNPGAGRRPRGHVLHRGGRRAGRRLRHGPRVHRRGASGARPDHLLGRGGVVCLTGVSSGGRRIPVDTGQLGRTLVLENDVVFGTVNANRRHWQAAAEALRQADLR